MTKASLLLKDETYPFSFEQSYTGWAGSGFDRKIVTIKARRVTRDDEAVQLEIGIAQVKGNRWYERSASVGLTKDQARLLAKVLGGTREPKKNEARFTHQYTAEDCPGRPCGAGCDHRGLPPKER